MGRSDVYNKILPERIRVVFVVSCLVIFAFLPAYLICVIHDDLLVSKTNLDPHIIKIITICFILTTVIGTLIGLVIFPVMDIYDLMCCIIFIKILGNALLLAFSFVDTFYSYRIVILLMVVGLTVGMVQTTVTTYFGYQYKDNDTYTLLHHFMLYFLLHVLVYVIVRLIVARTVKIDIGAKMNINESFAWQFLLSVICNFAALALVITLSKMTPKTEARFLNPQGIHNIEKSQLATICILFWPFAFVLLCVLLLLYHWHDQCKNLDRAISTTIEYQCIYTDYSVAPVISLLCLPILKFIIILRKADTHRIKVGICFIAISAIMSGIVDYHMSGTYFTYYNVPKDDATIRVFVNDGHTLRILGDDTGIFRDNGNITLLEFHELYPLMNLSAVWAEYNQTNITYPSNTTITSKDIFYPFHDLSRNFNFVRGQETWNIYHQYNKQAAQLFIKAMVYRRPSSLPMVFIFANPPVENATFSSWKLNISTSNNYFHEMQANEYNLSTSDGTSWGKFKFNRGGFYVILMLRPPEIIYDHFKHSDNLQTVLQIIKPHATHIIWPLLQYLVLILGVFILVTSTLKLSYNLPNENLKCAAIAIFFLMSDFGYLLYFVFEHVFHLNLFMYNFTIAVILIVIFCYFVIFVYNWDYLLLSAEDKINLYPKLNLENIEGKTE